MSTPEEHAEIRAVADAIYKSLQSAFHYGDGHQAAFEGLISSIKALVQLERIDECEMAIKAVCDLCRLMPGFSPVEYKAGLTWIHFGDETRSRQERCKASCHHNRLRVLRGETT